MAQLTINNLTIPIKNWDCVGTKYTINIQKRISFSDLETILNQPFYTVEIHFEEGDENSYGCSFLSFSTDLYELLSYTEKNDCFELVYENKEDLQPTAEEKLQAKLDYLSIMTEMDLDLQEV